MMGFKKGCKIEVFKKKETPLGSWWPAEIISGNVHTYFVRYYWCFGDMRANVEKVPRKAIRPCPPPLEGLRSWVEGDIVEVFNDGSWKLSQVSRIIGGYLFFVRLLGSATGFRANLCDIRVRQTWQDNNWMVILKDSSKFSDRMTGKLLSEEGKLIRRKAQPCKEDNNRLGVGPWISGTKKRPRAFSVADETGAGRKFRTIEEGGGYHRPIAGSSKFLHEKGQN